MAFQEVSDALIAQQTLVAQRAAQTHQVQALKEAVDLSLLRYKAGRASYFEVLEAEQLLFPAEDALAQTQRDQLLAVVNLYKALGGGWNLNDSEWSHIEQLRISGGLNRVVRVNIERQTPSKAPVEMFQRIGVRSSCERNSKRT